MVAVTVNTQRRSDLRTSINANYAQKHALFEYVTRLTGRRVIEPLLRLKRIKIKKMQKKLIKQK